MKERVKNFFRYRYLLWELVKKGIKLKYRRSYLGILWSLLEPLLTMIVLTVIFGTLLGNNEKTFAVYVLSGRLLYSFFSQATTTALRSVRGNSAMIKKVYVPKYLYPDAAAAVFFWRRNDTGNSRSIFPGYGISLECGADAGYVYVCHFLLSRPSACQRKRLAAENEPLVLYHCMFQR